MIEANDLVPGITYRVRFSDCCVSGEFTDVLVVAREEDGILHAHFENGVVSDVFSGKVIFTEANQ